MRWQAQDSPTQEWVTGWVDWLGIYLKWIFLAVVFVLGLIIMVRAGRWVHARVRIRDGGDLVHESHWIGRIPGGPRGAILFGLGAALVLYLLTHVDILADLLRDELPID